MEKINAEVFVTVAALGSYKSAADELGYTQPGIAYIINTMEEQTGLRLFEREYGGVKLTSDGEALLPLMQRLYKEEQTIQERVGQLMGLETGRVRILAFNTAIVCYLPDILREFKEQFPGIELELSACESSVEAAGMILAGEADCAFLQVASSEKLEIIPIGRQEDVMVVSKEHPSIRKKVFPIKELGNHPYIGCSEKTDPYNFDFARKYGVKLNQVMIVNNDYGCFSMISQGLGIGIYPRIMVEKCMFPVKAIPFDVRHYTEISAGFKSYDSLSAAAKAFVDFLKDWEF